LTTADVPAGQHEPVMGTAALLTRRAAFAILGAEGAGIIVTMKTRARHMPFTPRQASDVKGAVAGVPKALSAYLFGSTAGGLMHA